MIRIRGRVRGLGLPSAVFFVVGTGVILHVGRTLMRELRQLRRVADAAQNALLRPLPSRIEGLDVAAAQLSAERGAAIGGDLYEVLATEHGVRAVMGDVRGHGIGAFGTVAAVLGCFREAAYDEEDLGGVLHRLERALDRHLRREHPASVAEEFVTLLLVEIRADGEMAALNCGHPWPYRLSGTRVEQLAPADPYPPLGVFPLPDVLSTVGLGHLPPGDALFLYTDGAQDARDARGRFFPLPFVLASVAREESLAPQAILRGVQSALADQSDGTPADDIALLVLRNGACMPPGARGTARTTTTDPQPTTRL
ncbi:PP2C family protein-serine/threonine phosphatase [Streptomyces violarus]|uniref:PP2C family protein-serine/threonine phosphatase n=1 Tax=Streptomyces violarus TaxID=67380 RepID=UPI0021C010E2|nr:PP2C family protein-serine/threonine phosphatase [Streptomyces violarus]MCT9141111.1 serine/threonine-protein phosphatase [Streptomyces violarus]